MYLKDKFEIIGDFIDQNELGVSIVHLLYIDHEEHKFYIFNTRMDFFKKKELEDQMGVEIKIENMYHKMIDTKPGQSEILNIDGIKTMQKKGYINEEKYHKYFALIRRLKIEGVLDEE